MEVLYDDNFRVWRLNFGTSGSKNDKTIFDHSLFLNKVRLDQ